MISLPTICFIIVVALLFIAAEEMDKSSPLYYFTPIEDSTFKFDCSEANDVDEWILPSGSQVSVHLENGTEQVEGFEFTQSSLTIPSVKTNMVGRYTCVLRNNTKHYFYIPYVLPKPQYKNSILLSLGVSAIFSTICAIVWLVERYCFRDDSNMPDRTPITRKKYDSGSDTNSTIHV